MQDGIFTELSIIIAIGAGIAFLMRLIHQPLIIGYILTGIVVGPSMLNVVTGTDTIEVFASIGIALLLFIIGLGLNPRVVKEVGKVSLIAAVTQMFFTALIGFLISNAIGFTKTESIIIGLALAFSSTIIVLKLLSDKKEQSRLNGKIAIGILLVQDVAATLALVFITARSEGSFSFSSLAELALNGALLSLALFIVANKVLPKLNNIISSSQELLFLFAIGWGFGVAAIFEHFGFSVEVGALFAGVALAAFPYAQEVASRLRPLRDFFIIVFFISLGTHLGLSEVSSSWLYILLFSLIVIWFKPFILMITMGLMGYTKNTSFKVGSSLSQISEFSLVLVALGNQQGLVRPEIVNILTFVAIITIAISAYAITFSNQLYRLLEKRLALFERNKTKTEQIRVNKADVILFGYSRGGHEFLKVFQEMKKKYIVIDYDPEAIDLLERNNIPHLYGDAQDFELLEEIGLERAKLIVSTITNFETNIVLIQQLEKLNPNAVSIVHAENIIQAEQLYAYGASYVMLPHYIGSERMGAFIRKNGFDKNEFRRFREKHLHSLQTHLS